MSLGRVTSIAPLGITGTPVDIEVHAGSGIPGLSLIGLPDRALSESTERVRAALTNSGFDLPPQRLTINLSPADLPKQGSGFDVGIALAVLVARGVVRREGIEGVVVIGELALDGRLRPTRGVLPLALAALSHGYRRLIVPTANLTEAQLVSGLSVRPAASLREAAIACGADLEPVPVEPLTLGSTQATTTPLENLDLADVMGNSETIEALIVAAAGGHHMMMVGPPGAGKTMLAARLPGILPDMSPRRALESACVRSLEGAGTVTSLSATPPFIAPHHTISAAAMVGGGGAVIRPGAITRANGGVLFLDEAPEFRPNVLDCLRQPLEAGTVTIHRALARAEFPAQFLLVMAANPCPCGMFGEKGLECTCSPVARRRYFSRLSGPLLDRIDIHATVVRTTQARVASGSHRITSGQARSRVLGARQRARDRLEGTPWFTNAEVAGAFLHSGPMTVSARETSDIDRALRAGSLTRRGYDRVLRMAWTIADLENHEHPTRFDIGRALYLRQGVPV